MKTEMDIIKIVRDLRNNKIINADVFNSEANVFSMEKDMANWINVDSDFEPRKDLPMKTPKLFDLNDTIKEEGTHLNIMNASSEVMIKEQDLSKLPFQSRPSGIELPANLPGMQESGE